MTDSEDDPSELESDDPPVKVSPDVPQSTNALHSITLYPVHDRGVSSGALIPVRIPGPTGRGVGLQ